jgi:RNA polymerase primary sigma factor
MAVWWIRQAISRAIEDTGRSIRLPVYQHRHLRFLHKEEARLLEDLGRLPTDEELALATGLPLAQIEALREIPDCSRSLSETHGEDDDLSLGDTIADPEQPLEEQVTETLFSEQLQQTLRATLTPREYQVIQKCFGLGDQDEERQAQIARDLGISRERVRQIEVRALSKLRQSRQILALCAR